MRDIDCILEEDMDEDDELDVILDDVDDEIIDELLDDEDDDLLDESVSSKIDIFNDPIII